MAVRPLLEPCNIYVSVELLCGRRRTRPWCQCASPAPRAATRTVVTVTEAGPAASVARARHASPRAG